MSLKAIHLVFIIASTLLCVGFGGWSFFQYKGPQGATIHLVFGISSTVLALVLVVYGRYFLKKLKGVSYL